MTTDEGLVKTKYDLVCERILELDVLIKQTAFESRSLFDHAERTTKEHKQFLKD